MSLSILHVATEPSTAAPTQYFTGSVRVTPLVKGGDDPSHLTAMSVSFECCARAAWHSHPAGQMLVVTEGEGRIQQWGEPVRVIRAGDVIWTPPNVKHWHGAAPMSAMTHVAIQEAVDGKVVEWMIDGEVKKVTDEEYSREPEAVQS